MGKRIAALWVAALTMLLITGANAALARPEREDVPQDLWSGTVGRSVGTSNGNGTSVRAIIAYVVIGLAVVAVGALATARYRSRRAPLRAARA